MVNVVIAKPHEFNYQDPTIEVTGPGLRCGYSEPALGYDAFIKVSFIRFFTDLYVIC